MSLALSGTRSENLQVARGARLGFWLFQGLTCAVVVLALLLGGGTRQGLWSDVLVQLASLPLLAWMILSASRRSVSWSLLFILCSIVALPLVQLIPLPPSLWTTLPGREGIVQGYVAADMPLPWLPISLNPSVTWRSLVSLVPPIAVFLAMSSRMNELRDVVVGAVLVVAVVSVFLALLQLMGGPASPLRFHAITNQDRAVGFFANANHYPALLYCAIPLAIALAIRLSAVSRGLGWMVGGALVAVLFIGIAVTTSRAGLGLGLLAVSLGGVLIWPHSQLLRRHFWKVAGGIAGVVLLIVFHFAFTVMADRIEGADLADDLRWPVASITTQAAMANMPFGSGMGTFAETFQSFEPRTLLFDRYVNRAHNDYLEIWLEGGLLALSVLVMFFGWLLYTGFRLWRADQPSSGSSELVNAQAGCILIGLLVLHSAVDYPLRTTALMVVFAVGCALCCTLECARQAERGPERKGR